MGGQSGYRIGWQDGGILREEGGEWRRRPVPRVRWDDLNAGLRRWLREPEPFEPRASAEAYPGGTVLEDMQPDQEHGETLRILARYTVVRLLALWGAGWLHGPKLHTERRIALEHLSLLPADDWERRSLERLAGACRQEPSPAVLASALGPAMSAARADQPMGAFALYRCVYELGLQHGWLEQATAAAAGIARLSRMYEAPRSRRIWGWRARVLAARARLQRQAEAEAQAEARKQSEAEMVPEQLNGGT
jgi:hypothetical protein